MERKFDLKTIIIAALLFFGFVFLIFYKYSNAAVYPLSSSAVIGGTVYDTDSEGNILLQGIFGDETKYNSFRSGVEHQYGITIPEYSSASDFMDNICDYFLGCVFRGTDTAIDTVLQGIDYVEDILTYITFDPDLGDFVVSPNNKVGLLENIRHSIYDPAQDTIGYWVPLPQTLTFSSRSRLFRHSDSFTGQAYICGINNNGYVVAYKGSQISGFTYWVQYTGDFTCSSFYQGSLDSGYYNYIAGSSLTGSNISGYYSSYTAALVDFFGNSISDLPTLKPGISVFDDPSFTPLSLPASVVYNFDEIFSDPDPLDPSIPSYRPYSLTYDVPYWLTVPSSEPLSFELPSDYDFNNIDFDYEADPSFLSGAGIIQDVFNILPSKLQGLIFLFGAGSLAFIFLRR